MATVKTGGSWGSSWAAAWASAWGRTWGSAQPVTPSLTRTTMVAAEPRGIIVGPAPRRPNLTS